MRKPWWLSLGVAASFLAACQAPLPTAQAPEQGAAPLAALGAGAAAPEALPAVQRGAAAGAAPFAEPTRMSVGEEAIRALTERPNVGAMDQAIAAAFQKRPQAQARRNYTLQAPSLSWAQALGGACTNTLGISKPDTGRAGPGPYADEWVYVLRDDGTLTKRNPITGAVLGTRALGGTFTRTAVQVSGDNRRLYVVNTAGTLHILKVSDLSTVWSGQISYSGFTGSAPFIDYGNGGGFPLGTAEYLTVVANDASVIRILVNCPPANINPNVNVTITGVCYAASGTANATSPMLGAWTNRHVVAYTGAQSAQTGGVSWMGDVWFGTQAGMIYRLATTLTNFAAAPTLASWNVVPYTMATGNGRAVGAPPSIDFDNNFRINAAFFSVADRAVWIDPSDAEPRVSPPLILDKIPPVAQRQGWLSNFPYTTALSSFQAIEWASVAAAAAPTPTRWGNGGAVSFSNSTGTVCWTIRRHTSNPNILGARYTNPGQIREFDPDETILANHNSITNQPWEVGDGPNGDFYVSHTSSRNVTRFNADGSYKTPSQIVIPNGIGQAYWPMGNAAGDLWISTSGGRLLKYNAAGTLLLNTAVANVYCVDVDAASNVYYTRRAGGNNLVKLNNAGTQQWAVPLGGSPLYVMCDPNGTDLWVTVNTTNRLMRINPATGAILNNFAMPTTMFGVNIDDDGNPWVCFTGNNTIQKFDRTTGANIASYSIPGSGTPYEVDFDGNGDAWVGCQNGLYKISDLGNLSDIFGSEHRGNTSDTNNSYGMVRFRVPNGTYGGQTPVSAQVRLTAATTPISAPAGQETLTLSRMSPYLLNTTTNWIGYTAAINVDYNNRPLAISVLDTRTNQAVTKDVSVDFNAVAGSFLPLDKVNTSDAAGGIYAYGIQAQDKVLRQTAHWYSNTTAPAAAQRPTLRVNRVTTALNTNNGLRAQPGVDSNTQRMYIASCNAVFELPYTSKTAFEDPAQIAYNYTQAGTVSLGPIFGGAFYHNRTSVALNGQGQLIVSDQNPTLGTAYLNRLNVPFYPTVTTNHVAAFQDLAPANGTASPQLLWDYANGSAYLSTSSNHAVRTTIWQ